MVCTDGNMPSASMRKVSYQSGSNYDSSIMKMAHEGSENVKFSDQADPYLYTMEDAEDPTRKLMDSSTADLGNFFKRPIKIHEEEWGTGTLLYFSIDPWSLYIKNPRVLNRMTTYHLFRSKLRLKIVVNGNSFQYGRALASYLPLQAFDDLTRNVAFIQEDLVQASQLPHVFLNPTLSTGGEMSLPFFYFKNNAQVSYDDYEQLGQLNVRAINSLKHANGAADKVTVSVFAWLEDVSLNVLTSKDSPSLTTQSGYADEIDEANAKGAISGPATAVKNAANALKVIPPIQPFAVATETAAGAVASMAKHFGYCRPPVTKAPDPYRPTAVSSLAVTNVPDVTQKLTVDDKQELSIDPRISGLGNTDSLNIKEIASRESYLTTFAWPMGTAPETLLWNSRVTPVIWAEDSLEPKGYHFPAVCMAAMPFKYWTGTMKFRFQFVTSAFHKGRVKIVYDPNFISTNEYNTNYLEVIDISEKNDFTLEFGNGQAVSLLGHYSPGFHSQTEVYSSTQYTDKGLGNGVVSVYVVNELTTPNSAVNNDIEVNVYVSAGDDFEVFVPHDHFNKFVVRPQSGDAEKITLDELDAPQQAGGETIGVSLTNYDKLCRVYTGESIQSFRTLLKRYNLHTAIVNIPTGYNTITYRASAFPYYRGNVPGAVHVNQTDPLEGYNYCNTTLLHWVTTAFSGWRGSIRWKVIPRGLQNPNYSIWYYAQRVPLGVSGYQYVTDDIPNYDENTAAKSCITVKDATGNLSNPMVDGLRGCTFATSWVNPIMEFEVPFYSPYRFAPAKVVDKTSTLQWNEGYDLKIITNSAPAHPIDLWVAAGEDFQTYFWTGLPVMYYETEPP